MADDLMIQVRLRHGDSELVCWLERDSRLRAGVDITLRGDDEKLWRVEKLYPTVKKRRSSLHKSWKVGGLK